jgi:hypothetical protein
MQSDGDMGRQWEEISDAEVSTGHHNIAHSSSQWHSAEALRAEEQVAKLQVCDAEPVR